MADRDLNVRIEETDKLLRYHQELKEQFENDPNKLNAPISMLDGRGRRLFRGWACEARTQKSQRAAGWAGVLSLPRVLDLSTDGNLIIDPAPELESLRHQCRRRDDILQPWPRPWTTLFSDPYKYEKNTRNVQIQKAPFQLKPGENLQLRVFLDRSILEVFANRRQCVTQRLYPSRSDSLDVVLFCKGGSARVVSVEAWKMDSIGL